MSDESLNSNQNWLQKLKRRGTKADRKPIAEPQEPARPTTIDDAIEALADNNYPAAHLICPEDMSKTSLRALTEALRTNESLTSIDLANNELDKELQEALLDAVSDNKNITSITGMNAPVFTSYSEQRTLNTNITAVLEKNQNDVNTLSSHILNPKALFDKPREEIQQIADAINERTAAIYQTLEKAHAQGKISSLGAGGIDQIYNTANIWARSISMHDATLNMPNIPAEALDNLTNSPESTTLVPFTRIHAPSATNSEKIETPPAQSVTAGSI